VTVSTAPLQPFKEAKAGPGQHRASTMAGSGDCRRPTPEILAEIRRVLERFGVTEDGLDLTDTSQVNRLLESRGADIYLLCTIGSWKDTMSDQVHDLKYS